MKNLLFCLFVFASALNAQTTQTKHLQVLSGGKITIDGQTATTIVQTIPGSPAATQLVSAPAVAAYVAANAQTLSASGTTSPSIALSTSAGAGGGTVTLSGAGGLTMSRSGNNITLTQAAGTTYTAGAGISIASGVISNTGDGDDDPGNEFQTLNYTSAAGQVTISGGNTVTIPVVGNGDRGLFPSFASLEKVTASTSAQAIASSTSPAKSIIIWIDANGGHNLIFKN